MTSFVFSSEGYISGQGWNNKYLKTMKWASLFKDQTLTSKYSEPKF